MQSGLLLDVVVRKGATILKLFAGKDQSLLVWGNALFILNLGFHIFNCVRRLNLECNGFASQGFDENLHTSSQTEYQMQSGLLLDVVIREGTAILKLFASKDQPLLVWGNAFFILDFGLDIFDGVRCFYLKGDGLACQSFNKNLHTTSQTENQMQSGLFLDVVVREGTAILKLFAGKNQPLLVWGNAFLVLDLCFNVLNGVRRLNLKSNGLASQSLDKNLHATTETENQMQSGLLLDVVVRKGATILKLFASKDQPLLVWGNSLLVLDFGLDIFNGVRWFDLKGDGLASQGLDKNLHTSTETEDQVQG